MVKYAKEPDNPTKSCKVILRGGSITQAAAALGDRPLQRCTGGVAKSRLM